MWSIYQPDLDQPFYFQPTGIFLVRQLLHLDHLFKVHHVQQQLNGEQEKRMQENGAIEEMETTAKADKRVFSSRSSESMKWVKMEINLKLSASTWDKCPSAHGFQSCFKMHCHRFWILRKPCVLNFSDYPHLYNTLTLFLNLSSFNFHLLVLIWSTLCLSWVPCITKIQLPT